MPRLLAQKNQPGKRLVLTSQNHLLGASAWPGIFFSGHAGPALSIITLNAVSMHQGC
jgi:hypothetical protein